MGDVAHIDDRSIDLLDGQSFSWSMIFGAGIERHIVFELADLLGAGRQHQVLRGDGVDDVSGGKPVGLQCALVEVNLHLPHLAAVRRGNGRAGDGRQLRADEILPKVE